jgi:putative oxidoreductase
MKNVIDLIARMFLSFIFLYEAYDSIAFFKLTRATMIEYGITWNTDFLLISAIVILILGGLLILIGYRVGLGGILLLMYWIPVTFIVYSFWNDPPDIRRMNSIIFMKNIAIVGGLLMVIVKGSGKYSVKRLLTVTRIPKGET